MKIERDYNDNMTVTKECKSCGYMCMTEITHAKPIVGDEDFIQLGQTDIINDKGGWHERIEKTTLYACPKCGCVHIEI